MHYYNINIENHLIFTYFYQFPLKNIINCLTFLLLSFSVLISSRFFSIVSPKKHITLQN